MPEVKQIKPMINSASGSDSVNLESERRDKVVTGGLESAPIKSVFANLDVASEFGDDKSEAASIEKKL